MNAPIPPTLMSVRTPTTMVMLIQLTGRGLTGEVGYASALSFVLFLILLGLLLVTLRLNRREDRL